MSNTIYIYLKTHNITGLKYLGKTTKDPFKYNGSGKYWKRHINKHGYDITTDILLQTDDINEAKSFGETYSDEFDIVESKEYANLIRETATGGDTSKYIDYDKGVITQKLNNKTWSQTSESNIKRSISHIEYWESDEAEHRRHKPFIGPPRPPGWFLNNNRTHQCPHCDKMGDLRNMKRWHFDNCKYK